VKKIHSLLLILACSALSTYSFSHGGGLNAQGCHNETATGGYHCHRSSYTPSNAVITSSSKSNPSSTANSSVIKKVTGTFETSAKGFVFKNARCTDSKWRIDIINRTSVDSRLEIVFYTEDADGDPLQSFVSQRWFGPKKRETIILDSFDCNNVPFEQLKHDFRVSLTSS
jgi:hypothetical protein